MVLESPGVYMRVLVGLGGSWKVGGSGRVKEGPGESRRVYEVIEGSGRVL